MPATRLTMRKIREVLRLKFDCRLTKRQIAKSCAIARSTVAEYLRRFTASGLNWPLSPETDDEKLEQRLFPPAAVVSRQAPRAAGLRQHPPGTAPQGRHPDALVAGIQGG